MTSIVYGVIRNGRRGIDYVKQRSELLDPKPKEMVITLKPLCSHFTYGHTHDTYFSQKPWVNKTHGRTNHKGAKKMWVLANKFYYINSTRESFFGSLHINQSKSLSLFDQSQVKAK